MKFKLVEKLKKATPYMLRNDGELLECGIAHPYIKYWFEDLPKFDGEFLRSIKWFYNNSNKDTTKDLICIVAKYLISTSNLSYADFDIIPEDKIDNAYLCGVEEFNGFINTLNADTNQEFCRARTSSKLYGGTNDDIYFRVSSIGFNWFPLMWQIVYTYKPTTVTICKDDNTFGGRNTFYKINREEINRIPYEDFILMSGNPIIEQLSASTIDRFKVQNELKRGETISESFEWTHPRYAYKMYQQVVGDWLGYDINNLLRG